MVVLHLKVWWEMKKSDALTDSTLFDVNRIFRIQSGFTGYWNNMSPREMSIWLEYKDSWMYMCFGYELKWKFQIISRSVFTEEVVNLSKIFEIFQLRQSRYVCKWRNDNMNSFHWKHVELWSFVNKKILHRKIENI